MTLRDIIAARIAAQGPIRFSDYMGLALYHPEHGYYVTGASRVGRAGDFITSVSVGSCFGELMAEEFCRVWESLGRPGKFKLIEQGANDGQFARDVLTHAPCVDAEFAAALQVRLREPLPRLRALQAQTLREFPGKVDWLPEPAAQGVFFSNELLDALPVDRWLWRGGQWHELRTGLSEGGEAFCDVEMPGLEPDSPLLPAALRSTATEDFPDGYQTEFCPGLPDCVASAVYRIEQGQLYFADYGFPAAELRAPHRTAGSLRGYRAQQRTDDPYAAPGETDLTTHVDWTAAAEAGTAAGAEMVSLTDQGSFLTRLATRRIQQMEGRPPSGADLKWLRQFQTLTHPGHMGRQFQMLVLKKGR